MAKNQNVTGGLLTAECEIEGNKPMLFHNAASLADPISDIKLAMNAITKKRAKDRTEQDTWELRRLEFVGGLYLDDEGQICMPDANIRAAIIAGAKKQRMGTSVASCISVSEVELKHPGPTDVDGLWADPKYRLVCPAVQQKNKVIRVRCKLPEWSCAFRVDFDSAVLDALGLKKSIEDCGRLIGLGDWHGLYGKFTLKRFEVV
jgi:hypothetical protein